MTPRNPLDTAEARQAARDGAEDLRRSDPADLVARKIPDLDKPQRTKVAHRLGQMPVTCRGNYLKAMGGKAPVSAVKAFCLMCVGWQREHVRLCTDPACPLFPYRPFRDRDSVDLGATGAS